MARRVRGGGQRDAAHPAAGAATPRGHRADPERYQPRVRRREQPGRRHRPGRARGLPERRRRGRARLAGPPRAHCRVRSDHRGSRLADPVRGRTPAGGRRHHLGRRAHHGGGARTARRVHRVHVRAGRRLRLRQRDAGATPGLGGGRRLRRGLLPGLLRGRRPVHGAEPERLPRGVRAPGRPPASREPQRARPVPLVPDASQPPDLPEEVGRRTGRDAIPTRRSKDSPPGNGHCTASGDGRPGSCSSTTRSPTPVWGRVSPVPPGPSRTWWPRGTR